tara:strand:- start:2111 stop:2572 length:462 start_codon:yes stop_codon:yes gene_type:complete
MRFATETNFVEIYKIFKRNRKFFPNIRISYLLKSIQQKKCIFNNGVIIIFSIVKSKTKIGKITTATKSDCHINQILASKNDGSASKLIRQFFSYIYLLPYTSGKIFLNVRNDNFRAMKFYERNGMKLIDTTNWKNGLIKGYVYQMKLKKYKIN